MAKHDWVSGLLVLLLLFGLGLLCYPGASDLWNRRHQSRMIAGYLEDAAGLADAQERLLADARAYNRALPPLRALSEAEEAQYLRQLDVTGTGIMGYLEIPRLRASLPIYHGTSESVLQIAVGHIAGSALPVGGAGSHCVLTGHRGLPSARLFTDLDELRVGDTFRLCVLDEVLTYEVDQIRTVVPADTAALAADPALDLCTLVTCTPYGVNTHRLLVRGRRVKDPAPVVGDAVQIGPEWLVPIPLLTAVLGLLALLLPPYLRERKRERELARALTSLINRL